MFGEIANPTIKIGAQKWYTVPVSILAHVAAIAAVLIVPLLAAEALPQVPSMMAFVAAPPPPPPPPPAAQAVEAPIVDVNPNAAPIEAPAQIAPETGFDLSSVQGVDGGIAGGVVGGIVGGLLQAPPPPPPPPEPVRVGGNIQAPTKVTNVDPRYPPVAQAARVQGVVILEAVIGPDGRVTDVKVLRSVPLLDEAAIDAVRQWAYTPTLLNGVAVPVIMTVTVNFQLR
jgi:protein TonB